MRPKSFFAAFFQLTQPPEVLGREFFFGKLDVLGAAERALVGIAFAAATFFFFFGAAFVVFNTTDFVALAAVFFLGAGVICCTYRNWYKKPEQFCFIAFFLRNSEELTVNPRLSQPWIALDKIERLVQLEPFLACVGLALGSWLLYIVLLRGLSRQRHESLRGHFKNLLFHTTILIALFVAYYSIQLSEVRTVATDRAMTYVGLCTLLAGVFVFVKASRVLVFEYLFLTHMRVGVPLLLVNLCTLLLSLMIGSWLITEIFDIKIAPLLATSAVFSLVVGLALQDTLGNLFSGVALQMDEPYQIGDWIEVNANGNQKWVGLVDEISWRATVLIGWQDEAITIPNRVMGQAHISNFSAKKKPIARSQTLRIAHGSSVEDVRKALLEAAYRVHGVRKNPAPSVMLADATESWLSFRLIYFIDDYGAQYAIGDKLLEEALKSLHESEIEIAAPRLDVTTRPHVA